MTSNIENSFFEELRRQERSEMLNYTFSIEETASRAVRSATQKVFKQYVEGAISCETAWDKLGEIEKKIEEMQL